MTSVSLGIRWRLTVDAMHTSYHPSGGSHDDTLRTEMVCADSHGELQALVALMLRRWDNEHLAHHGTFSVNASITYYRITMSTWRRSEERPGSPAEGLIGSYTFESPTASSVLTLLSLALESFTKLVGVDNG